MVKRILDFIGWLGTALVFVAVASGCSEARVGAVRATTAAWAGLCLRAASTCASQWREIAPCVHQAADAAAARSPLSSVARGARRSWSPSTTWRPGRTSAGTSPRTSSSACRIRRGRSSRSWTRRSRSRCSISPTEFERFRDRLERVPVRLQAGVGGLHRSGQATGRGAKQYQIQTLRHRGLRVQGPHRARHVVRRTGSSPTG